MQFESEMHHARFFRVSRERRNRRHGTPIALSALVRLASPSDYFFFSVSASASRRWSVPQATLKGQAALTRTPQ